MIELLEGVPGSGKSYYAVSERFLKWVRANRRIYVYVDGIYLDRLAAFEGSALSDLAVQITVWRDAEEVKANLSKVDLGSAVLLDEVQTIFRAQTRHDASLLRWLETHRHYGVDVLLMCQDYRQVSQSVTRLVEVTTKFRRLDRLGLRNRYQAQVRGNPEETEVIRMFAGRYEPKVYAYYSSYAAASVREQSRGGSMWRSPTIVVGVACLVGAALWFTSGTWLSTPAAVAQAKEQAASDEKLRKKLVPPSVPAQPIVHQEITPIRLTGSIDFVKRGKRQRLWLAADGRFLTQDEVAALSGGTVFEVDYMGVKRLSGTGVQWGGQ